MQSGRQTLTSIDQAVQRAQQEIQQIDEQVQATSNALIELQKQQTERFKKLAELRMDQIVSGGLVEGLDAAHRRVGELLEARTQALGELDRQARELEAATEQLERRRVDAAGDVDKAAETLDTAEAGVQQRLQQNAAYQKQLEKTRAAERIAAQAEAKTEEAQQTRVETGKPYENDRLFLYLWQRGYGTSRYSANALTRFLDDWVARLCDYHDARPNYAMLLEIPERLRKHADSARADADREFEALKSIEENAAETDGVGPLREALGHAEHELAEIDDEIEQSEAQRAALLERRARFSVGEDEHFREAVQTLSDAFERENLSALFQYAAATPTAEDDVLVQELAAGREQTDALNEALEEHKRMQRRHLDRVKELEDVRHRFKRERYDSAYSSFGNGALVATILGQFLQGLASRDDLWRTIQRTQRHHRVESRPDFGSGGFGRRNGTWRTPFPGGARGGGGFRTGGSF